MSDLEARADDWKKVQKIRDRFCEDMSAMGEGYAALCAVDRTLDDRCTASAAGVLDQERARRLLAGIVALLAEQHAMSDEQVVRFVMQIAVDVVSLPSRPSDVLS